MKLARNEKGEFRGPTLLWHRPTSLEQSTGLDMGSGVRGGQVCWARTCEWEEINDGERAGGD